MFKLLKDRCVNRQVNLILAKGIFDFIFYINIKKGTYQRKCGRKDLPYSLQKEGNYKSLVQSLQSRLCADTGEFSENMELPNVLKKLSLRGEYAVQCRILIKGQIYHKRILFFGDCRKENIIAFVEDVTGISGGKQETSPNHMTAYLSHEIRTVLNSLSGNLYALQAEGETFSKNRYLKNVVFSVDYLKRLVNSALHISEIENNRSVMKLETVTLEEMTEYFQRVFEQETAEKNIQLQFLTEKPIYQYLYLCKDVIWQIITNLISNAIKYTGNGGTVTCYIKESYLEEKRIALLIEITDTGIGMTQTFLSMAWEPYAREQRGEGVQGSGLGLAITKYLVELLRGNISIESQFGLGTKVSVNLEVDGDDVLYTSCSAPESDLSKKRPEQADTIKKALIAEDEDKNREVLCRYLCELGIAADKAHNGREAIEIFERSEENYYDVILMDIHMPDIGGMEAVRIIRSMNRKDSSLPIIAITADSEALSAEINDYLIKPYSIEDIRHILSSIRNGKWHETAQGV